MAGGPSTVSLTAGASEAGAMGSLGGAYSNAATLKDLILETKKSTKLPFAVNLFAPARPVNISEAELKDAIQATKIFRDELKIKAPVLKPPFEENFEEQFAVVLETKPAALSFIFGSIGKDRIRACQSAGILTFGTATSVEEAKKLVEDGVDAIIAQGSEAGGHRGFFDADTDFEASLRAPMIRQLLPEIVNAVKVPVIAAGGIMTGQDISDMLKLGAVAVQMGTAFLACNESGTNAPFLTTLLKHGHKPTALTRAFSGRWARGIENHFVRAMKDAKAILPFPAQNVFTRDIRAASFKNASSEYMSLWAGSGVEEVRSMPVRDLIANLKRELDEANGR